MDRTPMFHRQRLLSRRFLRPEQHSPTRPQRLWGPTELFAEGQWQAIRVQLESQGWSHTQIDLMHDQLRRGWPLAMAKRNVALISGHCPLRSRLEV